MSALPHRGHGRAFDHLHLGPKLRRDLYPAHAQARPRGRVVKAHHAEAREPGRDGAPLIADREKGAQRRDILRPDTRAEAGRITIELARVDPPEGRLVIMVAPLVILDQVAARPCPPGPFQFFTRFPISAA
jgi:hypothetical protein